MNLRAIHRMDEQEYYSYFLKFLDDFRDTIIESTSIEYGHAGSMHTGLTDEQMLGRCKIDHKNVSQFVAYSEYGDNLDVKDFIAETLYMKAKEIARWVCDRSQKHMLELSEDFGDVVGYGYEKDTEMKKDTSQVRIILRKTYNYDSNLGFFIETAYPEIDHPNARYITQLSRDPYKDGNVVCGTLDDVTEIRSKEDVIQEIAEQCEIKKHQMIKEEISVPKDIDVNLQAQADIIHEFAIRYDFKEEDLYFLEDDGKFIIEKTTDIPVAMAAKESLFICQENIEEIRKEKEQQHFDRDRDIGDDMYKGECPDETDKNEDDIEEEL